mmetsp:Transcript_34857/g.76049  ORF Transcript_34857/g.76049 Transcript_34857/m.76049 type:complete len:240 (+) Transcript_34857:804-1523(+)
MGHRDEASFRRQQLLEHVSVESSLLVDPNEAELHSGLFGKHLPRDYVGVVLHGCRDDLISGLELRPGPRPCHQVDGLGGVSGEDDLYRVAGSDEFGHLRPGTLEGIRGPDGEGVHPSVHVAVVLAVEARHLLEDAPRLVRGGRVVQVDQWHARSYLLGERGEVRAASRDVSTALRREDNRRRGALLGRSPPRASSPGSPRSCSGGSNRGSTESRKGTRPTPVGGALPERPCSVAPDGLC